MFRLFRDTETPAGFELEHGKIYPQAHTHFCPDNIRCINMFKAIEKKKIFYKGLILGMAIWIISIIVVALVIILI